MMLPLYTAFRVVLNVFVVLPHEPAFYELAVLLPAEIHNFFITYVSHTYFFKQTHLNLTDSPKMIWEF